MRQQVPLLDLRGMELPLLLVMEGTVLVVKKKTDPKKKEPKKKDGANPTPQDEDREKEKQTKK